MKVVLVGQGRTGWDDAARLKGTIDVPLSARGRKETARLARGLSEMGPVRVVSGTGRTGRETARILSAALGCKCEVCSELGDVDHGLWEGMLLSDLEQRCPRTYRQWRRNPDSVSPPGGESMEDVLGRVREALSRLRPQQTKGTLVMVLPEKLRAAVKALLTGDTLENAWSDGSLRDPWTDNEM